MGVETDSTSKRCATNGAMVCGDGGLRLEDGGRRDGGKARLASAVQLDAKRAATKLAGSRAKCAQ